MYGLTDNLGDEPDIHLSIYGEDIQRVCGIEYVEVILHEKLSFNPHVLFVVSSLAAWDHEKRKRIKDEFDLVFLRLL